MVPAMPYPKPPCQRVPLTEEGVGSWEWEAGRENEEQMSEEVDEKRGQRQESERRENSMAMWSQMLPPWVSLGLGNPGQCVSTPAEHQKHPRCFSEF